jgi:hypothetical protein
MGITLYNRDVVLLSVVLLGLDRIYQAACPTATPLKPQFHLSLRHNQPRHKQTT